MSIRLLILGLVVLLAGCQRDALLTDSEPSNSANPQLSSLCQLEPVHYPKSLPSRYHVLADDFCGQSSPYVQGIFDSYMECQLGTPTVPMNCCPITQLYLGFGGTTSATPVMFEVWGTNKAGFTYPMLADNWFTLGEQNDFLDRVTQAAANANPFCATGAYSPVAYEFEWVPYAAVPGDAEIRVKVTYHPVCLF